MTISQELGRYLFDRFFRNRYHYCMSKTLLFETKSVLAELKNLRKAVDAHSKKLSGYESFLLANSYDKGSSKQKYYLMKKGSTKRKYLGTDRAAGVNKVKAAKYYKKLLQIIDKDIRLLEAVNNDYVLPDHASINSLLPKVYRTDSPPVAMPVSKEAAEWKKKMEERKAKYAPFRPEELKHTALDGTPMRSLSEVNIANYLISLGITYVYELPLTHHGKTILPDFTILSPIDNKTVIIIEHQGAMGNEEYHAKFIRTVLFYLGTKLVPNKDVFFTFNHLNGALDLKQIDCILHIAFGFAGKPGGPVN